MKVNDTLVVVSVLSSYAAIVLFVLTVAGCKARQADPQPDDRWVGIDHKRAACDSEIRSLRLTCIADGRAYTCISRRIGDAVVWQCAPTFGMPAVALPEDL